MLFGDEEETGEIAPASVPAADIASSHPSPSGQESILPLPCFTHSPIEAWWRNGPWSGESVGAAAPTH